MVKTKTKIQKQLQRKRNPELVKTILAAKKQDKWVEIASILTGSKRKKVNKNINEIEKEFKASETIVIPGKVLSMGEPTKKMKIVALNFSEKAKEKLLNSKCQVSSILEEIKSNPSAKGIKILK
jgi:large subunit ribosomal protein L18e